MQAVRRGGEAWDRMLTEIDKEVAKLGGAAAADAARGGLGRNGSTGDGCLRSRHA